MYLKRLQVQGFKTFALKTDFQYDEGITAIVGPNGSGKSNIADAIRWVLGEQRYSVLRGRKTEDVIFAGSALKPAMGFAEASITFDNTDHKLPLDFSEVTITRRAYRTGENEYYINKSRVRLKDITEATLPLSQTYTVITQGMVDAALSQKPEERRGLFEDAASVGLYNLKKAEAQNSLHKQEENSRHIEVMIAEIEPRLKGLERHARQAEEFYTLRGELQILLKRYYGDRWHKTQIALSTAHTQEEQALIALENGKAEMEQLQQNIGVARAVQNEKRTSLAELHRESSQAHSRAQQLQQAVAVDQERLNGLGRQRETQEQELVNLQVALESANTRLREVEQEHAALIKGQGQETNRLAEQETLVKDHTQRVRQAEEAVEKQRQQLARLASQLENVRQRQAQLVERRNQLAQQTQQFADNKQNIETRRAEIEENLAIAKGTLTGLDEQATQLLTRRRQLETEQTSAQEAIRQQEKAAQAARSKLDSARSRLELLNRLQSNFTGLYGGVKSVMQASGGPQAKLHGIRGLVANLLQAPAEVEVAIEVALGMHLQDVIVERFEDAEKAIAFLKSAGAGRATFLPLDNLRSGGNNSLRNDLLNRAGVRGIATDLISFDAEYRPVYEQLLGRVLIVDDLQIGRDVMREITGGWTIVTIGGEILRSGGAVTGGASGQGKDRAEGSVLMRERELRELPIEISRAEKLIAKTAEELSRAQGRAATAKAELATVDRDSASLSKQQQTAREKLTALNGQLDRLADELKLRTESYQKVAEEGFGLDEREKKLTVELDGLEQQRQTATQGAAGLEKAVRTTQTTLGNEREKLAAMRTASALAEQRLKGSQDSVRFVRGEVNRLQEQITTRQAQSHGLEGQYSQLQKTLETAQVENNTVAVRLEELRSAIGPLEAQLTELEAGQSGYEQQWSELSTVLLSLEGAYSRSNLETQRLMSDIETLRTRASDDLAPSMEVDGAMQEGVATLETVDPSQWEELLELTEREAVQLAERVEQLRNKLRRIGAVNPLAMQEYKETKQRYDFLTTQLKDLEETGRTLRTLIKELDEVTQARFAATFERVAVEFKRFFGMLFNGGQAKLILTEPDDVAHTGIEILAQPPGKRQQNLSLLSGGERALTAIALLFALLEVNPSPFCVLDEVDAAMDESNVGRFCETLRTLSHKTQFVVITHNRGTIEAARTIYGVSMGPESVSKIMSLRVDEVTDFKIHGARSKQPPKKFSPLQEEEPALN